MGRYRVRAKNTATESENKIHDDAVASKLGFTGGLVPGVDVYAYLCHPPAERWGEAWLERGTMSGRFSSPVYDGDEVEVETVEDGDSVLALSLYDSHGALCATGRAELPPVDGRVGAQIELLPAASLPDAADRAPASADSLGAIDVFGSIDIGFHADRAFEYLDDIRESLPLYRERGRAHPAWLLRQANYVLSRNVRLGPWIHVSSDCTHLSLVDDGDRISVRGRLIETTERKGHKFVELDVQWVANDVRPVMRARHTAIYEPRGVSAATA